jgi:putative ATP-dependent endonuclease of OLD family
MIDRIVIQNYKCIKRADIKFNAFKNIIVGNNGVGKSTLIEALSLALGYGLNKLEITPYIFNTECLEAYKISKKELPQILIEVYFDESLPLSDISGLNNSKQIMRNGLYLKISFDEGYRDLYTYELQNNEDLNIPCEYYKIERFWFSQQPVKQYKMPCSIQIVDTSSLYFSSSSTQYISQLIQKYLGDGDSTKIRTSLRHIKENFDRSNEMKDINEKIQNQKKGLTLSVDVTSKVEKRDIICPFMENIPVSQTGAGEICHLKALLALGNNGAANKKKIIIIEEPEVHMSHTKMYEMLNDIVRNLDKENDQIIITTHNSFVANKLDLSNLILLDRNKYVLKQTALNEDEKLFRFFGKICHYPTLRMILCKSLILVEGPADEMVVTYHYYKSHAGKHPFNDGIELITVNGTAFKEYVQLMKSFSKRVAVVTDNDSCNEEELYKKRGFEELPENIKVFHGDTQENYSLEPCFVDANKSQLQQLSDFIRVKKVAKDTAKNLVSYMENNKTEWSFKLIDKIDEVSFDVPQYIKDSVQWVKGGINES